MVFERELMANFQASKEYVRGQLMSMGIENISEEDLDAYTRGKEHVRGRMSVINSSYCFRLFQTS